jgi:hypothetical protein
LSSNGSNEPHRIEENAIDQVPAPLIADVAGDDLIVHQTDQTASGDSFVATAGKSFNGTNI